MWRLLMCQKTFRVLVQHCFLSEIIVYHICITQILVGGFTHVPFRYKISIFVNEHAGNITMAPVEFRLFNFTIKLITHSGLDSTKIWNRLHWKISGFTCSALNHHTHQKTILINKNAFFTNFFTFLQKTKVQKLSSPSLRGNLCQTFFTIF